MHAIALTLALSAFGQGQRELVDRIVSVVNDDVITMYELRSAAAPYIPAGSDSKKKDAVYRSTLDNLIADRLMAQQITEAKIQVTAEDVDRAIDDITRQNNISKEELESAIQARGMSMARYRSDLESQIVRLKLIDLKVRSKVVVTEADIREEYDRQVKDEAQDEVLALRHLFFRWGESPDDTERERVLNRALAVRKRLEQGEDFAEIARAVSEGPTAASGGDLGELKREDLMPELAKATSSLKPKEISPPVVTSNGVHIVRIDAIRRTGAPSFEDLKGKIHQRLYQAEVERQTKVWIDELRSEAAIEIRL